jgi:O-succinylbenzoic acid--CoA ligase
MAEPDRILRPDRVNADQAAAITASIARGESLLLCDPRAEAPVITAPDTGPALGLATSGSTGRPRIIWHSQAQLMTAGRIQGEALGLTAGATWLVCLPLAHAAGAACLFRAQATGSDLLFAEPGDSAAIAAALDAVSGLGLVPTQLRRLLAERPGPWPAVRVLIGGAACPPDLIEACASRGALPCRSYGMTETLGLTCLDGRPLPGVDCSLDDQGCLTMRLPWVDGVISTTDQAEITDGRVHILGRIDHAITSGGETILPESVESILLTHPAIDEAIALGRPDPEWGEVVVCSLAGDRSVDLEPWLRTHFAGASRPKQWRWESALPRTPLGKIDRQEIRRRWAD